MYKKCKERGLSVPESVTDPTGAVQDDDDDEEKDDDNNVS